MSYNKEVSLDELYRLAMIGLNEEQIAASLGISVATMTRRKKEDEDFAETLKAGKAAGIGKVTNALFKGAVDGDKTAAQIFFLKNRAKWSDRQEVEHSGAVGLEVQLDAAIEALKDAGIDPSKL